MSIPAGDRGDFDCCWLLLRCWQRVISLPSDWSESDEPKDDDDWRWRPMWHLASLLTIPWPRPKPVGLFDDCIMPFGCSSNDGVSITDWLVLVLCYKWSKAPNYLVRYDVVRAFYLLRRRSASIQNAHYLARFLIRFDRHMDLESIFKNS